MTDGGESITVDVPEGLRASSQAGAAPRAPSRSATNVPGDPQPDAAGVAGAGVASDASEAAGTSAAGPVAAMSALQSAAAADSASGVRGAGAASGAGAVGGVAGAGAASGMGGAVIAGSATCAGSAAGASSTIAAAGAAGAASASGTSMAAVGPDQAPGLTSQPEAASQRGSYKPDLPDSFAVRCVLERSYGDTPSHVVQACELSHSATKGCGRCYICTYKRKYVGGPPGQEWEKLSSNAYGGYYSDACFTSMKRSPEGLEYGAPEWAKLVATSADGRVCVDRPKAAELRVPDDVYKARGECAALATQQEMDAYRSEPPPSASGRASADDIAAGA